MRELLIERQHQALEQFRASLRALPSHARDTWLDAVLGIDGVVADEPTLPRGSTPYYPCSVEVLLRTIDVAGITQQDVFVDIGSGIGRATTLVHLLTGARAIGIEIQRDLVERARDLAETFGLSQVTTLEGDATELVGRVANGTVFFLYCPFSGTGLELVLEQLAGPARARPISVCCVHLPTLKRDWLELVTSDNDELVVYRSVAGPP